MDKAMGVDIVKELTPKQIAQKKWRDSHKEYIKLHNFEYKKKYREELKRKRMEYVATHQEEVNFLRQKNRLRHRGYCKKWSKKFPVKIQLRHLQRRSQTKDITIERIQKVYENNIKYYGTLTCYLCSKPIGFGQDCLEHKTPLSRGGNNHESNLDIAHRSCNVSKSNKTVEEYIQWKTKRSH
jgi:5-methylcytosine-specific restriction endonuclease McrA